MYVAALRVRSKDGSVGTNAFLHLHREAPVPMRGPFEPDLEAVGSLQGGYLVARTTEVRPGGNDVLAHLDLVAPDDVTEAAVSDLATEARALIGGAAMPIVIHRDGMAVRFGASTGLDDRHDELRAMFDSLWAASQQLLGRRQAVPVAVTGPYVVWIEPAADGVRLWLPPSTLSRLPQSVRRRARVLVPAETMAMGQPSEGLRDMAWMLLDIDEAALVREGGIELVDPRAGAVVATFPPGKTA